MLVFHTCLLNKRSPNTGTEGSIPSHSAISFEIKLTILKIVILYI